MLCTWKLLFMHDSRNDGSGNSYGGSGARRLLLPPFALLPSSSSSSSRFGSTRWLDGIYFGIVSYIHLPFLALCHQALCLFVFFFLFHRASTLRLESSQVKFANACIKTILACRNIESISESAAGSFHFISLCVSLFVSPCVGMHIFGALIVNCVNFKFK